MKLCHVAFPDHVGTHGRGAHRERCRCAPAAEAAKARKRASAACRHASPALPAARLPCRTSPRCRRSAESMMPMVRYTCPMRSAARAAARALRRPWWPRRLRQQRTLGRRVVAVAIVATSIGAAHPVADILHRTQLRIRGGPYCQQQLRVCLRWKGVGGRAGSSREQLCRHSRRARGGPPVNEPTGCPAALH